MTGLLDDIVEEHSNDWYAGFAAGVASTQSSPNGQSQGHYEATCSGCGLPFRTNRRPIPGKRAWCDNCRKSGEPGAQRARDYRNRRYQEAEK